MQKIVTLIIAAVILYTIVESRIFPTSPALTTTDATTPATTISTPTTSVNPTPSGNFIEKTLSNVLVNILKTEEGRVFFENILQPVNKPIAGAGQSYKINNVNFINSLFKIQTFGEGKIGPASCGHIVTIHYQILTLDNGVIEDQTKTFTLGFKPILPGIDSVIVGMMEGQTRHAILPPKYAYYSEQYRKAGIDPDSYYKINVTLQKIMPNNFVHDNEVKVFDDEIGYKMPLVCGDRAVFDAKITKLSNGEVIYDSTGDGKQLDIKVGDLNYPLIVAYGLYGKIPIGIRTVIAKGKVFKGLGVTTTKIFPKNQLPDNEYFMLELKNFSQFE